MPELSHEERRLLHIKCTSAALDKAKEALDKQAAEKAAGEKLIPAAVEALVKYERIDPKDRAKAAGDMTSLSRVLEILIETANPAVTVRPQPLGGLEQRPKNASALPTVCGAREGERGSDRVWREALLGSRS